MFLARFIILIFLMILSPLALIAYVIPGQSKLFNQWKDALIDQSFFAPIFFALTWVALKIANSPNFLGTLGENLRTQGDFTKLITTSGPTPMALVLNYTLVIGFSIAALVISKSMASKTAGFKQISGGIGTVAMGGAGLVGRNTIGRASSLISEKKREEWSHSTMGRAGLWMADKGKKGSFDVRGVANTGVGKMVGADNVMGLAGKATGKGGFKASVDAKAKAKTTYAKEVYGQTSKEKEDSEEKKKDYEGGRTYIDKNGKTIVEKGSKTEAEEAEAEAKKAKKKEEDEAIAAEEKAAEEKKKANEDLIAKKEEKERVSGVGDFEAEKEAQEAINEAEAKLRTIETTHQNAINKRKLVIQEKKYSDETQLLEEQAKDLREKSDSDKEGWEKLRDAGKERQTAYAERLDKGLVGTRWLGKFQPNQGYKEAARKVREQAKGKSKKERLADLAKEVTEDEEKEKKGAEKGEPKEEKTEEKKEEKTT